MFKHNIVQDKFGPEYTITIYDPELGMKGFLVIDNLALGPGKGGFRMTPDVTMEEVFRLARTMTWKNSLSELPFGGAKGGIIWNGGSDELKKKFVQSFAKKIAPLTPKKYIAAPDVNTGEREMKWFVEATGNWRSATGKPANLCMKIFGKKGEKCGIPHEFGSTGFGVAHATKIAIEAAGLDIKNTTISIEGFGNVGSFAFKYLTEMGAKIVAVSDKDGGVYDKEGLDAKKLLALSKNRQAVQKYTKGQKIAHSEIFKLPVDVLIPASVTDVINDKNKNSIKAKIIIEAANIPMQESIEKELHKKGILIIPDFIANSGGVISSYAEYRGYNPKKMFDVVERKITKITKKVLRKSMKTKKSPREIGMELAKRRVEKQMDKK